MKLSALIAIVLPCLFVAGPALAASPLRPTASIQSSSHVIKRGEAVVLSWNSTNAKSAKLGTDKRFYTHLFKKYVEPKRINVAIFGIGKSCDTKCPSLDVPVCGSMVVSPEVTTTYYLITRNRAFDLNRNGNTDGLRRATRTCVTVTVIE